MITSAPITSHDIREVVDMLRAKLDEIDTDDPNAIDDLESIIDSATSITRYAERWFMDLKTCNQAAELLLRAERKAAQWC